MVQYDLPDLVQRDTAACANSYDVIRGGFISVKHV